jgi:hypothetical protein
VLRCRAVCRSWRSLASEPAFLLDHHRHQPALHLISSYRTVEGVDDFYPAPDAVHLRGAELRPVFGFPELFHYPLTVDTSCDGVFIAGNYICNPATRQWAPLSSNPKRPVSNPVGLYRHQPSGEYRVLYWTHSNVPVPMPLVLPVVLCPNEYRVLTVGTNESRFVDCPLTKMIGARGPIICGAPVLLNGSLHVHWKTRSSVRYHKILVFDMVAETFRHMVPPPVNPRHPMHLLDMGGTLAAATTKEGMAMTIFDHSKLLKCILWID